MEEKMSTDMASSDSKESSVSEQFKDLDDYNKKRKRTLILGCLHLVMGFTCLVVGIIVVTASSEKLWNAYGGVGLGGSFIYMSAGAIGVISFKMPMVSLITVFLSLSALGALLSCAGIGTGAYAIWKANYYYGFYYYPNKDLSWTMAICSVVELIVCVWSCVAAPVYSWSDCKQAVKSLCNSWVVLSQESSPVQQSSVIEEKTDEHLINYRRVTACILGCVQFVIGIVCFCLGIASCSLGEHNETYGAYGIIGGLLFCGTGAVGVRSYCIPRHKSVTSFLVLSALGVATCLAGLIAGGVSLYMEGLTSFLIAFSVLELVAAMWSCVVAGIVIAQPLTRCCIRECGWRCSNLCLHLYGDQELRYEMELNSWYQAYSHDGQHAMFPLPPTRSHHTPTKNTEGDACNENAKLPAYTPKDESMPISRTTE